VSEETKEQIIEEEIKQEETTCEATEETVEKEERVNTPITDKINIFFILKLKINKENTN